MQEHLWKNSSQPVIAFGNLHREGFQISFQEDLDLWLQLIWENGQQRIDIITMPITTNQVLGLNPGIRL